MVSVNRQSDLRHYLKAARLGGSVRCVYDWKSEGPRFNSLWVWQCSFVEIDHEIFSDWLDMTLMG